MGASGSHENQTTPPKADKDHRLLTIDPRSPSCEISRTPIIVDRTPEGANSILDPRSPTAGIVRTPLCMPGPAKGEGEVVPATAMPKLDLDQDITTEGTVEEVDSSDIQAAQPCIPDIPVQGESASQTDLQELTELKDLSLNESPCCESTRLMPKLDQENVSGGIAGNSDNIKARKKKRQPQAKELFPSRNPSGYREVSRSPLSTRTMDMNSPLQIVQRKQIKEVDIKRSCALEHSSNSRFVVKDKENM